jgi:hypothetical protein
VYGALEAVEGAWIAARHRHLKRLVVAYTGYKHADARGKLP